MSAPDDTTGAPAPEPFDPTPANLRRIAWGATKRAPEHVREDVVAEVVAELWALHAAGRLDPARGERAWFWYAARIGATKAERTNKLVVRATRDVGHGAVLGLTAMVGSGLSSTHEGHEDERATWAGPLVAERDAAPDSCAAFDLARALGSVPEPFRGAMLAFLAGETLDVLAARAGLSVQAVANRVRAVRDHLRAWAEAPTAAERPVWTKRVNRPRATVAKPKARETRAERAARWARRQASYAGPATPVVHAAAE